MSGSGQRHRRFPWSAWETVPPAVTVLVLLLFAGSHEFLVRAGPEGEVARALREEGVRHGERAECIRVPAPEVAASPSVAHVRRPAAVPAHLGRGMRPPIRAPDGAGAVRLPPSGCR